MVSDNSSVWSSFSIKLAIVASIDLKQILAMHSHRFETKALLMSHVYSVKLSTIMQLKVDLIYNGLVE